MLILAYTEPPSPRNGSVGGLWLDALDDDEFADLPPLAEVSDSEDEGDDDNDEDEDGEDQNKNGDDDEDEEEDDNDEDEEEDDNDEDNDEEDEEEVDDDVMELRNAVAAGPEQDSVPPDIDVPIAQGGVHREFHSILSGNAFTCLSFYYYY